jgi:hypothetical protein
MLVATAHRDLTWRGLAKLDRFVRLLSSHSPPLSTSRRHPSGTTVALPPCDRSRPAGAEIVQHARRRASD